MNRGWSIALTLLMNACSGVGMFQLVQDGTALSKVFALGAWLCGNALALIGAPVVVKKAPAIEQPEVKP